MTGPVCACGRIHAYGDVVALSRFAGISGYRIADGSIYETRDDAKFAVCPMWVTHSPEAASRSLRQQSASGMRAD